MTPQSARFLLNGAVNAILNLGAVGSQPLTLNFPGVVASLGVGAGAGNFNVAYVADRTVSNGTPDVLNLTATLTTPDGVAVTFADVVLLAIKNNSSTSGQNLQVGGGTGAVTSILGATGVVTIPPGGCAVFDATALAAGYAVTTSTADKINVNVAAGSGVSYTVAILGH